MTGRGLGHHVGEKSTETGERYLPKNAREALSNEEYKRTSDKKRRDMRKGQQFSRQPKSIAEKTAKYRGDADKTRADLHDEAKRRDIPGRSKMNKSELADALGR